MFITNLYNCYISTNSQNINYMKLSIVSDYRLSLLISLIILLNNITKLENYILIIEKLSNLLCNLKKMLNIIFSLIIIHYNYKFTCNM